MRNEGPSDVAAVSVVINWPSQFKGGYDLMYLPTIPQVLSGTGSCQAENVNTRNLTVSQTFLLYHNKKCLFWIYLAFLKFCSRFGVLYKSFIISMSDAI